MALEEYRRKRDFKKTSEPPPLVLKRKRIAASARTGTTCASFVVQKHHASHLHYDFRLEVDGVLKSWAVPKGPSLDPKIKRLAMEVEDHPLDYASFEGVIPKGEYGAGNVIVWDQGEWRWKGDPRKALKQGRLEFELEGQKLRGRWILVRTRPAGSRSQWLLMKRADDAAIPESKYSVVEREPQSVVTGKLLPGEKGRAGKARVDSPKKRKPAKKKTTAKKSQAAPPELQLATLVESAPKGEAWVHEVKFDGYRTLARIDSGSVTLWTRGGLDWTQRYGTLPKEIARLPIDSAWIDGEIVVVNPKGISEFHSLQVALKEGKTSKLVFYVFDLLELDGEDLREQPLVERKAKLETLIREFGSKRILYSEHYSGSGEELRKAGCKLGLEGVISKRAEAPYIAGRHGGWVKSKCADEQEMIIGGYALHPKTGEFKSLLLGVRDEGGSGGLRPVGRVGTGFSRKEASDLRKRLEKLKQPKSPFSKKVSGRDEVHWVKPEWVAQIGFRGWTGDRNVRQGAFKGLREDKKPDEVVLERPKKLNEAVKQVSGVKLTHPNKVLIPDVGITKQDLVEYYAEIQKWILPHVRGRPLSLLRCPDGILKQCFFQKNLNVYQPPQLETETITNPKGKEDTLIYVENIKGLFALAQMSVIEIHTWGAHRQAPLNPDLMVFDIDPGPDVKWKQVVKATYAVRDVLEDLGLRSFVKVSGGKGFHVHVPIQPKYTWDEVKEFTKTIARHLENKDPSLYLSVATKAKRKGKIFVDYLRNGYGATSVAPYSLRAREGGCVALPIHWKEVAKVESCAFTLADALMRLRRQKIDPWKDYFKKPARIEVLEKSRSS